MTPILHQNKRPAAPTPEEVETLERTHPFYPLLDDPLTDEIKAKISHFFTAQAAPAINQWNAANPAHPLSAWRYAKGNDFKFRAIAESSSLDLEAKRAFARFITTYHDSNALARELGISAPSKAQIFAARIFIRTLLKISIQTLLTNTSRAYFLKMTGVLPTPAMLNASKTAFVQPIKGKYKLLMQDRPVLSGSFPSVPLNVILSHIHFRENRAVNPEAFKKKVSKDVQQLLDHPDTEHVMTALATLLQRDQRGVILIGNEEGTLGDIADGYYSINGSSYSRSVGLSRRRSIWVCLDTDGYLDSMKKSTFVHESLHTIFLQLVFNGGSPVAKGSDEEKMMNEALAKDQVHRANLKKEGRIRRQTVIEGIIDRLQIYFPGGFNPEDPRHVRIMQTESIVCIIEALVKGDSHEDVKSIAPNLYNFYFTHCKPLIERFIQDHSSLFIETPHMSIETTCDPGPGNRLELRGNGPGMGWENNRGISMRCIGANKWVPTRNIPSIKSFAFKFVLVKEDGTVTWETGPNRTSSKQIVFSPSTQAIIEKDPIPQSGLTAFLDTGYGNRLELRGNGPGMGWEDGKGIPMRCIGTNQWVPEIDIPFTEPFEFKYVLVKDDGSVIWETGANRKFVKELSPIFN